MSVFLKGRGAQLSMGNQYQRLNYHLNPEFEVERKENTTQVFKGKPKTIISKNDSPDVPFQYSINPYQGCEHGCAYCYARNSHEYWGFNPSLDFESKIISKPEAPELLRKQFLSRAWKPAPIILSGNTDCYQPVEKKLKITRNLLKVFLEFGNPVAIITKNILILRDLDIITELAKENLVQVIFSITSMDEKLRLKLEPRSAASYKKFIGIRKLKDNDIPCSVMLSPVIPGLNDHEIPSIIRESKSHGADDIHMSMVRLNGMIAMIFEDWLKIHFPEKKDKILSQIRSLHKGKLNDSRWGYRMRGDGPLAHSIHTLFKTVKSHYFKYTKNYTLDTSRFRRNSTIGLFS